MYAFDNKNYNVFRLFLLNGADLNLLDINYKFNILFTMQFL